MAKIKDIIAKLEAVAPIESQEEWDNSGWQVYTGEKNANNVLISLNITENVVDQAIKNNCDLIISHHPVFFKPIKNIKNKAIIKAIKNNIQIYSAHTNFDKAINGTTQTLVKKLEKVLGLTKQKTINGFVSYATLKEPLSTSEFCNSIKKALNLKVIKISKPCLEIKRIAICAGSGADFINELATYNVDCFISSDIKYHQALDCNFMTVDVGHFESEVISLESIKNIITMPNLNIIISEEEPLFEMV